MWTYRLGPARARQLMFTGDTPDARSAADEARALIRQLEARLRELDVARGKP